MDNVSFTFDEIRSALPGSTWTGNPAGSVSAIFTDTRETVADSLFIAFSGENFDAHDFLDKAVANGAKLLCVEKEKADRVPAGVDAVLVDSTVAAYQALARLHRNRFPDLHLLALTGSCGKTSTKETLRAILEEAYGKEHILATEGNTNNQIGVPRNLFRLTDAHQAAVIEMGTNHHGEIAPLADCALPESAMIVSIGNCHLEFLGSLEGVAVEKSRIFQNGVRRAVLPYGAAGTEIMRDAAAGSGEILTFGADPVCDFRAEYLGGNLQGSSFRLTKAATGESAVIQWHIPGAHQANNAAGAAALADSLGIPFEVIAAGIAKTTLPGMRMRITEHHGATWINEAYNANPDSMCATLEWLSEFVKGDDLKKLVLALGDMGELGSARAVGHRRVLLKVQELFPDVRLVTVGPEMQAVADALAMEPVAAYMTADEAPGDFLDHIRPGDLVLLKASRSMGMEKLEPAE